jgi:hypothetical protein
VADGWLEDAERQLALPQGHIRSSSPHSAGEAGRGVDGRPRRYVASRTTVDWRSHAALPQLATRSSRLRTAQMGTEHRARQLPPASRSPLMTHPTRRGLGISAGLDPGLARDLAALCEHLGYHSLWSNDEPSAPGLETLSHFAAGAPLSSSAWGCSRSTAISRRISPLRSTASVSIPPSSGSASEPVSCARRSEPSSRRSPSCGSSFQSRHALL